MLENFRANVLKVTLPYVSAKQKQLIFQINSANLNAYTAQVTINQCNLPKFDFQLHT